MKDRRVPITDEQEASLSSAILIYTGSAGTAATRHAIIRNGDKAPVLDAGIPLTTGFLRGLARELEGQIPLEVMPANVLVRTQRVVCWWTPRTLSRMFFAGPEAVKCGLEKLSGAVFPRPALVWTVVERGLYVRALATNERPDSRTPLFRAPYWNTDQRGAVCQGSMRSPQSATNGELKQWTKAYFESTFTHPTGTGVLARHPGGAAQLWRDCVDTSTFPVESLAPAKQSLGAFLEAL